jgi:Protein of unknown function (DUF1592)/Protein of unknown function (DUF1588)/Protein of unknown function (DUF1587)/Protein of unknown function (DUF1585)/Protein of unknown function (DUF1595)
LRRRHAAFRRRRDPSQGDEALTLEWRKFLSAALFCAITSTLSAQPPLANQYCAGCHNDKLKSGGFSLSAVDWSHPERTAAQAENVIRMIESGMMPRVGAPRPDAGALKDFAASIENSIDTEAAVHPGPLKSPALHRLNRNEYHNSIRDLLGVEVDAAALLPTDDMSHGFDNMADVLTVSPALMEAYIRAAGKVSRQALGDPDVTPSVATYHIPRVINQMRHIEGTPEGTRGGISVVHYFPADGEYVFKTAYYHSLDGPLFGKNQGRTQRIEISINGERVALLTIDPNLKLTDYPQTAPIKVKAGPQRVAAAFLENAEGPLEDLVEQPDLSLVDLNNADTPGMTSLPHLREFSVSGPTNVTGISETPSRRKILTCRPATASDEIPCARKIISTLARQAFHRPVTERDVEDLLGFYQRGRNDGDFESGIRAAIQTILADPEFVFRFEPTPAGIAPGTVYRVSELELASRLSYFLWSSAPDEELINAKLHDPAVLEAQVRRMLADPRSEALATNFAAEWLHLQNLKDAQPDAFLFPNFNRNLADSMRRESELLFESVIRGDRNILDLLTADYTFVDELLAKHYGIPNVAGAQFRRVAITDENRLGLLGHAGILTLTSISNRTSPVQRGKYVMEVLLGTPPPAPPPNISALEATESTKIVSVRERLEQHRKNQPCAGCHQLMDPIGFSLEPFDAVGAWRMKDNGFAVDAAGQMFDGSKLDGPVSLRRAILSHSDAVLRTFTENFLAYALGRVVDERDMPVVRAIDAQAAKDGNRFTSFVTAIVNSRPFQMRTAEETSSTSGATEPTKH